MIFCECHRTLGDVNNINITAIGSEDGEYGLSPKDMNKYWINLGRLRKSAYIWPEPHGLVAEGSKLLTAEITQASAAALREPFVTTTEVKNPTKEMVAEICKGDKMCVLKRENSGYSLHTFYPFMNKGKAVKRFQDLRSREEKIYGGGQSTLFPRPLWFIQPYMPAFVHLGEVRALFVNGTLYNTFITTPLKHDPTNLEVMQGTVMIRPSDMFE